ncbi:MAG: hypothetical protein H6717_06565 [Polyangiaceae bacterium]|nr:hypothetical protein [Polyangiaceae bacterium]
MPTCLFTGDALGRDTRVEHTIPRSLGGRVRSQEVSSNRFNSATSNRFDDVLWQPYGAIFNYLAPLLAREHAQRALELDVGGERQPLHPGGELGLRGMRVERRNAHGRPEAIVHEDPAMVNAFAANAGWGTFHETHEIANVLAEGRRRVPAMLPAMEIAALKCALLTLDHVLRDDPARFTRSGWLSSTRESITNIVLADGDPVAFLDRVSWGVQYEELEALAELRQWVGAPPTPFEHLVAASGNPRTGCVDVVWLLAGVDPWAFRLTRLWNGPPFTVVAGCGVLREAAVWPTVASPECLWELCGRSERRSCHPANVGEATLQRVLGEVSAARREGFRRAVDLVERRCDDVVRSGLLNLARFDDAEPIIAPGDTSIGRGLERRLHRLFWSRVQDAEGRRVLDDALAAATATLRPETRDQRVTRDDALGNTVDWPTWLRCHRSVLNAVANPLGLPGELRTISFTIEPAPAQTR